MTVPVVAAHVGPRGRGAGQQCAREEERSPFHAAILLRQTGSTETRTRLAWWITLICGAVATGMALFLAWRNVPSLWDEFLRLAALLGGGFPGVFALGLLTRRANGPGVFIGTFVGIIFTWWMQTYTATSVFFHTFLAISVTMIVGYLASFFLAARAPARSLRGLTVWDLRAGKGSDASSGAAPITSKSS